MADIENYYTTKDGTHFDEVCQMASNQDLDGWEEYYWAGLYLNEYAPDGTYNELIAETFEEAFFEGLTYLSDSESYLEAVRVLGKLYLELQQYDLALNMLKMLILKDSNVPDWVYLRYAYAQLHSDTAKRLVDEPEYLFERLDKIDATDAGTVGQRDAIFQDFLEISAEQYKSSETKIDTDAIFEKAAEYGVLHTESWRRFAGLFPQIFGEPSTIETPEIEMPDEDIPDNTGNTQDHLDKSSRNKIFEFFSEIVTQRKTELSDPKCVQGLAADILARFAKEKNIIRLAAIEGAVAAMADAMDSAEIKQRVAFSNARKIMVDRCGFSEAVAVDVTVEMAKAMKYVISLEEFDVEDFDEAVGNFSDSLVNDLEQENNELMEKIHELQTQMSELLRQNQDYEHLLEEKKAIIDQLTANEACIDNIERNAANGVTNGHDLLDGNKKILVIGQPVVSTDKLLGIVKTYGYEKNDFVFWDDYDKIKSYAERMAGGAFTSIIAGPMPHKVGGLGDYSSLIEKMKQPGYPYLVEARSEGGELKITKTSFRKAIESITKHLLAIQ
jgi:hypothetical protein